MLWPRSRKHLIARELLDDAATSLLVTAVNDASERKVQQLAIVADERLDEMFVL